MPRIDFKVSINLPEGVTVKVAQNYIRRALALYPDPNNKVDLNFFSTRVTKLKKSKNKTMTSAQVRAQWALDKENGTLDI